MPTSEAYELWCRVLNVKF